MKFHIYLGIFFVLGMTCLSQVIKEETIKRFIQATLKTCQEIHNVPDELVASLKRGEFVDTRNTRCLSNCILSRFKMVKRDGKLNKRVKAWIIFAPAKYKEVGRALIQNCSRRGENARNKCDASFELLRCGYDEAADLFIEAIFG